jgi:hypothetical protein
MAITTASPNDDQQTDRNSSVPVRFPIRVGMSRSSWLPQSIMIGCPHSAHHQTLPVRTAAQVMWRPIVARRRECRELEGGGGAGCLK